MHRNFCKPTFKCTGYIKKKTTAKGNNAWSLYRRTLYTHYHEKDVWDKLKSEWRLADDAVMHITLAAWGRESASTRRIYGFENSPH